MTGSMTKDEGIAAIAVRHLIEGHRTLYITTRVEKMQAMMDRIAAAAPDGLVRCVNRGRGDERIQARNGATVCFVTSGSSAGRGLTADVLLLDEVSDPVCQDALPCVAGSDVAQVHRYVREES